MKRKLELGIYEGRWGMWKIVYDWGSWVWDSWYVLVFVFFWFRGEGLFGDYYWRFLCWVISCERSVGDWGSWFLFAALFSLFDIVHFLFSWRCKLFFGVSCSPAHLLAILRGALYQNLFAIFLFTIFFSHHKLTSTDLFSALGIILRCRCRSSPSRSVCSFPSWVMAKEVRMWSGLISTSETRHYPSCSWRIRLLDPSPGRWTLSYWCRRNGFIRGIIYYV